MSFRVMVLLLLTALAVGCKNGNDTGDTAIYGGGGGDRVRGPDLGWRPVPVAIQSDDKVNGR